MKIFLDIACVLLWAGLLLIGALALLSAFAMLDRALFQNWRWPSGRPVLAETPRDAARFLIFAFNAIGLLTIVGRLRKIFITLVAGQPFILENARRLRIIGLVLTALEVSHYAIWGLLLWTHDPASLLARPDLDITGLFGIGVTFVLAEVFEKGTKMKKDLDLII